MEKRTTSQRRRPACSRRRFLRGAAGSAFAAGAAALLRPGAAGAFAANERINFGVVGCGGMGTGHVRSLVQRGDQDNIKVISVCDVYRRRIERARSASGGEGFPDYRKLLEQQDLHAILIATPDHWHAKIAIDAMEAGKDVYVEKPLSHTIEQALAVRNAVRRLKRVLQVGPQGTGSDGFWKAHEAIRGGRIGKVTWAHASYNRNARVCLFNDHQKIDPTAGPDKSGDDFIDWDLWLGHEWGLAPKIPWTPDHFFRFRKYWPYNGGVATDLLYHKLAPLLIAISGPDGEYPIRACAGGGLYVEKDGRDIPDVFLLTIDYPSEFSVFLVSTLTNDTQLPDRVFGKHGTMELGGDPVLRPNGDFSPEFKEKNGGEAEIRIPTEPRRDMEGNFIDAIRGKARLHCNVELGAATMVAIKLGVEAYRQRRTLIWDGPSEKVRPA